MDQNTDNQFKDPSLKELYYTHHERQDFDQQEEGGKKDMHFENLLFHHLSHGNYGGIWNNLKHHNMDEQP